jgi:hypothetical protein
MANHTQSELGPRELETCELEQVVGGAVAAPGDTWRPFGTGTWAPPTGPTTGGGLLHETVHASR